MSRRRQARGLAVLLLAGLAGCGSGGARPIVRTTTGTSPATATRFEISDVQDTTFTIQVRDFPWVQSGMTGIVVDPARRDVLVARFRVLRRGAVDATALVTGQTTKVAIEQAALIEAPPVRANARKAFWSGWGLGLFVGAVIGVLVGINAR